MATTKSKKALCHLVCQASSEVSEEVLKQELERNTDDLLNGILTHPKPTPESLAAFTSSKKVANKLTSFIIELSKFINVEESTTKTILQTYLAGDFRGTKESLKKLVNDERCQKPLLIDIWYFHQAEKLYNLRVLKEIFTNVCSSDSTSKHIKTYEEILVKLDGESSLKKSLIKQFQSLIDLPLPEKDKYYSQDLIEAWAHFNLKQQSEILQILLLYFHRGFDGNDVIDLLKIFTTHKFGINRFGDKVDASLVDSIGHLESILIVYLLDLPGLTETIEDVTDLDRHPIWKNQSLVQDLDKNVGSNLGTLKPHGPPMLAWMLSHYLVNQQISKHKYLGQRAFQLNVIDYLSQGLEHDPLNANQVVSAISHGVVYSLLSILVTAFDPSRMNISNLVAKVVRKDVIANVIWKEGLESNGLAGQIGVILNETPIHSKESVKLLIALAAASKKSADEVFELLNKKDTLAEPVEEVPAHLVENKGGNNVVNMGSRHKGSLVLNICAPGVISNDGKFYLWKMTYSGFQVYFDLIESLLSQVVQGAKNISNETLETVIDILELLEHLMTKCRGKMSTSQISTLRKLCLLLVDKFVHVPNPPVYLLAGCLRCLMTMPDDQAWHSLSESGLFPHLNNYQDLNPGIIGTLLAQQECVIGAYPMTSAWLDLLLQRQEFHHSIVFVVEEILPSYQNWRFNNPIEKETFGQRVLKVCSMYHDQVMTSLMKPLPNRTLINIASTGDRIIQSCYEAQNTSETGLGVEMAKLVILSLELLNKLLLAIQEDHPNAGELGKVISSSNEPHFLLIVAHYIYHLQTPGLALSSVAFLSSVATLFPMSLLACLGNDAEALRDILIHRLESQTEDVTLKVAILKFFSHSVKSQPGLIQLLLSVKEDEGCLKSVMTLLKGFKNAPSESEQALHVQLIEFVYNLWSQSCAMAVNHLKKQTDFWKLLTLPLFGKRLSTKINGFVLRILSTEIFAFKGNVGKDLINILEKLFDEKSSIIQNWCDLMVTNSSSSTGHDTSILSADEKSDDIGTFLLASWKTLLMVLSKDQPVSLSPGVCHKITDSLIKSIRAQMTSIEEINMRMLISLSETCLILMQRWLTKCSGDSITDFMDKIAAMLDGFAVCYEVLHPRARIAILGIASTALKFSMFKIDNETETLLPLLPSACVQVEKSLQSLDDSREAVLALGLLRGLLQRLTNVKDWYGILHQKSILMSILSHCHHSLKSCSNSEVVQASLGLLLTLSKSPQGCQGLLAVDLSQMIWLPLSSINKKLDKEWIRVFTLALQLALNLLKVGQQHALDHILTVVALLQEQLTAFLIGPKNGNLEKEKMDLTAAAATLIGHLMPFYKQWQMVHPSSLNQFYGAMCSLLHTSACLLIRPSLLNMIVNQKSNKNETTKTSVEELQRVRRLSSTDHDTDSQCPDTIHVQNKLLDTISSCLRMLIALSPDLVALVTDDIADKDAFEQLLQIGFSTPAFEQDESHGLSYGTIISISNFCIRTMTHGDRSPSPARSGPSSDRSTGLQMDRKRLLMVLEQCLTLMLAQALLCLSHDKLLSRDKQLLRRELGAELGSVNETMRRYFYRSLSKSPQTVMSPTPGSTHSARLTKSDEQFMKFVANIVQKVFK